MKPFATTASFIPSPPENCPNYWYKLFITLFIAFFSVQAIAEDQAIAKPFAQQGVDGTIVISSLHSGRTFIHNDTRANRRFTAASTFKILNTLIALEEKAISGKDDVFKWDGHIYAISNWNHDQTLESAFKVSCVWFFQELARKIGADKYSLVNNNPYTLNRLFCYDDCLICYS